MADRTDSDACCIISIDNDELEQKQEHTECNSRKECLRDKILNKNNSVRQSSAPARQPGHGFHQTL